MFNDLISGAVAGALSRSVTAPLELYKMQLQNSFIPHSTIKAVIQKEGIRHLWKGNGINCIRLAPQYSINFAVFNHVKNNLCKDIENENVAYGCDPKGGEGKSNRNTTFILTGFIDSDFPHNFKPPPFSFNDTSSG